MNKKPPVAAQKTLKQEKQERMAKALRENLLKRKDQQRQRAQIDPIPPQDSEPVGKDIDKA